ncbi:unnamed protein product, partial [Prorocentrum cordatum]
MGWGRDPGQKPPLDAQERAAILRQCTEAVAYLASFDLIHRDIRGPNIMVHGRGAKLTVRVIDLGHTIISEEGQEKNKSAVVKCNWKESEGRHFDWAPVEVKHKSSSNFSQPVHAFDVFSLAMLALQLEIGTIAATRRLLEQSRTAGVLALPGSCGNLGIPAAMLERMLGEASQRPAPEGLQPALPASDGQREGKGSAASPPPPPRPGRGRRPGGGAEGHAERRRPGRPREPWPQPEPAHQ